MRGTTEVVTTTAANGNPHTPPHTPRNESAQPIPDLNQQSSTKTDDQAKVPIDTAATAAPNENTAPPKTFKQQIEELNKALDLLNPLVMQSSNVSVDTTSLAQQKEELHKQANTLNEQINEAAQTESGGYDNAAALHQARTKLMNRVNGNTANAPTVLRPITLPVDHPHTPNMPIVTALTREQQQAKAPTSVRRPKSKPEPVDGRIVAGIKNNKTVIAFIFWLLAMAGIFDACLRGAHFGKLQGKCDASANAMRQNNILPEFVILAALVLCAACTAGARFAWRKIIDACYNNPNRIHNGNQYQKISREENGSGDAIAPRTPRIERHNGVGAHL